jgi:predicted nucleic acid-binding protein
VIFVDSNIPMYLVGAAHPHKETSRQLLEDAVTRGDRLVTDAEVLQEILHRYHAIRRPDAIEAAFDALLGVVDDVYPVDREDVERAKALVLGSAPLSARDAVHVAIMKRRGVSRVMSFDAGFDHVGWIERLG